MSCRSARKPVGPQPDGTQASVTVTLSHFALAVHVVSARHAAMSSRPVDVEPMVLL